MKTIEIETESRPLAQWLPQDNGEDVVYLTQGGRPKYVLVPFDEGDEEVLAVRQNAPLMAYIAEAIQRARSGPTKSLAEIKQKLGISD